jgi:putative MFS transporter
MSPTRHDDATRGDDIDEAPLTNFHRRLVLLSGGGPFLDGFVLTVIGFALIQLGPEFGLSSAEEGLLGAAALIGVFFGGACFGYVTDRVGRQLMYAIDLCVLIVASVLCAFVTELWQLVALRFLLGIAVGADYPIATAMMTEFLPRKWRGAGLALFVTAWSAGAVAAGLVGLAFSGIEQDGWRWMLASAAVPGLITVLLRIGTPESPRWLMSKGREDEAQAVMREVFGPQASLEPASEPPRSTSLRAVFTGGYLGRTLFVGLFWLCQVVPLFAVATFGPLILESFDMGGDDLVYTGAVIINGVVLLACFPGVWLVERAGRRPLVIWGFAGMTAGLLILGIVPNAPVAILTLGFGAYSIFAGASNVLEGVYPNELFPTEVRATAMGIGTAISRIGAAIGTYLVPESLDALGVGPTVLIGAAFTGAGMLLCIAFAPETRGLSLASASQVEPRRARIPA